MHFSGPQQPTAKALGFASCISVLRQMCDRSAYAAFLSGLDPETRAFMDAPPNPELWLPMHHWMRFVDCAHRLAFGGDDDKITALSEAGMMAEMQRIHTRAMRFTSPQFVLTRAAKLWQTYSQHNGHVETSGATSNGCEVHYLDVPSARVKAFLPFQRGVTHALLKLCGKQRFGVRCLPALDLGRQTLVADWQD